jgi:hypothetical protein
MAQRKTAQFNMRMDPDLKEVAEKAAAADRRSLSSLIEKLLEDYCRISASSSRSAREDGRTEPFEMEDCLGKNRAGKANKSPYRN